MDQYLSRWIHEHQAEIQRRWWTAAQEVGLVSETALEQLSQEDAFGPDSFRFQLLASLDEDGPPDPGWAEILARELNQSELVALLGALRQALFGFLAQHTEPQYLVDRWRVLDRRIDDIYLVAADAFDTRLTRLDIERQHWHTLCNLTRELNTSIDLSYVLQNAIARVLDTLNADRGAVLLLDAQTDRVTLRAAQDWQDVSLNLLDLPPEWQRGHGGSLVLKADDGDKSALKVFVRNERETVMAAPLLANGRFHGILAVATANAGGFDPQRVDLIDAVVSSIAISLGSSEVIQTLSDQARELGLMLRQHQEDSSKREAILASIADGVVFNDQRGRIILVNRAAELILSTRAEDLIDRDLQELFDLFTAAPRDDITKAMKVILSHPKIDISPEAVQTVLQIDGSTISAHLAPVITEGSEFLGIVTIFRDITKEVEADRAKSEFVSTVSHELRTPMTAIKGYTDLIYSETVGEINENQRRFLGIIKSNTDRLTALINDLLDISRVETGRVKFEPEPVKLGDIVKNVIDALAPSAENKGHTLTLRVAAGLPEIMGDANRLTQVFTNLVGNAINYTPDGGVISVDVFDVEGAVRVDIEDSGIGIYAKDLSKIFERFYRADHPVVQESRGTGLGLSIVRLFVEMHGGRVWAESAMGRGSRFTVLLPSPTEEREDELELISPKAAVSVDRHEILLADDDPDIAQLVKLHLEEANYGVTVVGRGINVLEIARRHSPDVIILDVLLPDMNGQVVLEALKSEPMTADIPVVMLSIVANDGTTFDLGAADYLTKPIDVEDLLRAVEAALSRRGRVLVVEDDLDTIEMLRIALRRVGYSVDVAADGYEALSLARRWRPQAIVLDLRLPGMDGYETLTHLKRNLDTQDIPIIVISAHVADTEGEERRLEEMGVERFLPKPFAINRLVAEIDRVIDVVRSA